MKKQLDGLCLGAVVVFALAGHCRPAPTVLTAADVLSKLIEAGCLAPDDDAGTELEAVSEEHAMSDQPAWMACLFDGGAVQACGAPCSEEP